MLFMNVLRNMVHMQHVPSLLLIHIREIGKQECLISIGTTRLDLDASCNKNGPSPFLDLVLCFLVPIIVKCNKTCDNGGPKLIDLGASTCFIDKELM
jgi:hypothetical protein